MNIFIIAMNELRRNIREVQTFLFYLAFPIVLMLILGTALANTFDNGISVDDIHVLYNDKATNEVSHSFHIFKEEMKKSDIYFHKASAGINEKDAVKQGDYDVYMELDNNGLNLYGNELNTIKTSIVQGVMQAYVDKYNLVSEVTKINPAKANEALKVSTSNEYIKEKAINSKEQPSSMDYYAIVMTSMIALFSLYHCYDLFRSEKTFNIDTRLMAAPIRKADIFIGKLIGCFIINAVSILTVLTFSKFVFKANWGNHPLLVIAILFSLILFGISLGMGISHLLKTPEAVTVTSVIIVQLACFFGGAYFPMNASEGGTLNMIATLSPLTWTNEAIKKIIFTDDLTAAVLPISLNLLLAIILLSSTILSINRKEGI
ncbi:ABC transporter permease [Metabacillus fastidiosus]|uniref:ABC transporter permease n=1 Tax=Metabacillus fastidiosus TaxID=1458 RepID=UPI00082498F3|nr:ABC transporter permease [Metabacillus fastidiosus]MED4461525.1 ABC transporter permease [Metabacillus fastidiosus]